MIKIFTIIATTAALLSASHADPTQSSLQKSQEEKFQKVSSNMGKVAQKGPRSIALANQAILALGEGYTFYPEKEAKEYMDALGNLDNPGLIGMVMGQKGDSNWIILIKWGETGHIKDEDTKNWNADEMSSYLEKGVEEENNERKEMGSPALQTTKWIQKPTYDSTHHKVSWSFEAQDDKIYDQDETYQFVNSNTYILTRHGFLGVELITSKAHKDTDKTHLANILQVLTIPEGNRYEDYLEGHDNVCAYGVSTSIFGYYPKEISVCTSIGNFMMQGWKLIVIGLVVFASYMRKPISRKKRT